jgi:hypothetical protein
VKATIDYVSGKGWFLAHAEDDTCVFIPQKAVEYRRYLKINDRVKFDVIPSTREPGQLEGINVKYLGHIIAAQYSTPPPSPSVSRVTETPLNTTDTPKPPSGEKS